MNLVDSYNNAVEKYAEITRQWCDAISKKGKKNTELIAKLTADKQQAYLTMKDLEQYKERL